MHLNSASYYRASLYVSRVRLGEAKSAGRFKDHPFTAH
jgi:hypothetical protein